MTDNLRICTTCNGMGQERRQITNPHQNVYGWTREPQPILSDWYRRPCEPCYGTGYTPEMRSSVPAVRRLESRT